LEVYVTFSIIDDAEETAHVAQEDASNDNEEDGLTVNDHRINNRQQLIVLIQSTLLVRIFRVNWDVLSLLQELFAIELGIRPHIEKRQDREQKESQKHNQLDSELKKLVRQYICLLSSQQKEETVEEEKVGCLEADDPQGFHLTTERQFHAFNHLWVFLRFYLVLQHLQKVIAPNEKYNSYSEKESCKNFDAIGAFFDMRSIHFV
jgi:hypothetical protein